MENEKKNNGTLVGVLIGIILVLIVVIGLFATGTIGFKSNTTTDNSQTNDNNQNNINDNTSNVETTTTTSNQSWIEYLLTRHILNAEVSNVEKKSTVTLDELNEVLPKFENTKVIKTWYNSRGSMVDGIELVITYENDEKSYNINISANNNYCEIYGSSLNEELTNILESSVTNEKNSEMKSTGKYFYELDGCDGTVLDKYIK